MVPGTHPIRVIKWVCGEVLAKGPGQAAKLCFGVHLTMENRHGVCVRFAVTPALGVTESAVAIDQQCWAILPPSL